MSSSLVAPSVVLPCRRSRAASSRRRAPAPSTAASAAASASFRRGGRANVVVKAADDGPTWVGEEETGGNGSEEMANQDGALGPFEGASGAGASEGLDAAAGAAKAAAVAAATAEAAAWCAAEAPDSEERERADLIRKLLGLAAASSRGQQVGTDG